MLAAYWRTRFFLNVDLWSLRHFLDRRRVTAEHVGVGYSGSERVLLMKCDRCGMRRLAGQQVEMHPQEFGDGWWHECLRCALASMTARVEAAADSAMAREG